MAWGDILGGIGAVAEGVNKNYMADKELASRERIAKAQDDSRNQIALMNAGSRERMARDATATKLQLQADKDSALYKLRQLVNAGNVDVQRLKNEGMAYVRELENEGILDREDRHGITLINLKNIDKEIQTEKNEAAQKRVETQQAGANLRNTENVKGRFDVANMKELNANQREAARNLQRAFSTEQHYGYQHGPAAMFGDQKYIGQRFGDWLGSQAAAGLPSSPFSGGARGFRQQDTGDTMPLPPSQDRGLPPIQPPPGAFDQFEVNPMFRPSSAMPSMGAPPPTPPTPQPQPPQSMAAPPPAAPPTADFMASLPDQSVMPSRALGAAGAPLMGRDVGIEKPPPIPTATGRPPLTEELKRQAFSELQRRIADAQRRRDTKQLQSLQQQLEELLK